MTRKLLTQNLLPPCKRQKLDPGSDLGYVGDVTAQEEKPKISSAHALPLACEDRASLEVQVDAGMQVSDKGVDRGLGSLKGSSSDLNGVVENIPFVPLVEDELACVFDKMRRSIESIPSYAAHLNEPQRKVLLILHSALPLREFILI